MKVFLIVRDYEQSIGKPVTVIKSFVNVIVPYPVGVIIQLKHSL